MNVSFKTVRRCGDKAYVLSEITGYDGCSPVVLSASTDAGVRIPSATFPYCDVSDKLALQRVLSGASSFSGAALDVRSRSVGEPRQIIVVLPWLEVKRWELEFRAVDDEGSVVASCRKTLDVRTTNFMAFAGEYTSAVTGEAIERLDEHYIHDRIHVSFLSVIDRGDDVLVSASVEMPYRKEASVEFDFLDARGNRIDLEPTVVTELVTTMGDGISSTRRRMTISFVVSGANPRLCLCATDAAGTVAPGFAMLGTRTLEDLSRRFIERTTSAYDDPSYHEWYVKQHRADLPTLLEQASTRFANEPLFSFVCVLSDVPFHHVHDFTTSIAQQSYGRWELILVDMMGDHDLVSSIKESLGDERVYAIEVDPGNSIDDAFNVGMGAAEGDFVVIVAPCSMLSPDMLFSCVKELNIFSDSDVFYSDVDTVDAEGTHLHPILRPAFSPELLRSYNYIRDLLVVRSSLLGDMFPLAFAPLGQAGYDFILRVTEKARRVVHVPRVLCHRRFATEEAFGALCSGHDQEMGRKALVAHCKRKGIHAEVLATDQPDHYRVRHVLVDTPHVAIVVLALSGDCALLGTCIRALYGMVSYRDFEVVVVEASASCASGASRASGLEERYENLSVLTWEGEADRVKMANFAASQTQGEFLLFLNDDTRITTPEALEVFLGYFQSNDVGIVGPKQLFVDGTIEHAGIVVGGSRVVTPLFRHMDSSWHGYLDRASVAQNVSAVTGDCMMVRRSVLDEVGGFDESFSLFYADVDLCLRAREKGYFTVFTPHVCLSRFHSISRVTVMSRTRRIEIRREEALLQVRWPRVFEEGDAFYNPNLDPDSSFFALKPIQDK